jgi:hypothetical protein
MSRLQSASGLFCYPKTLAKIKSPGAIRFLTANYKIICACNKLAATFPINPLIIAIRYIFIL